MHSKIAKSQKQGRQINSRVGGISSFLSASLCVHRRFSFSWLRLGCYRFIDGQLCFWSADYTDYADYADLKWGRGQFFGRYNELFLFRNSDISIHPQFPFFRTLGHPRIPFLSPYLLSFCQWCPTASLFWLKLR